MAVDVVYETHAITVDNETGRATGWLPGQLSERGREAAARLGERRRNDGLSAVYTSDLGRAVETAEIAFGGTVLPIIQEPRLRECNYGTMNGAPREEVHATGIDDRYPEGETWHEAVDRVDGFLDELARTRDGQRVLVIGHMSAWYALECRARSKPLEEVFGTRMAWREGWEYVLAAPPSAVLAQVALCLFSARSSASLRSWYAIRSASMRWVRRWLSRYSGPSSSSIVFRRFFFIVLVEELPDHRHIATDPIQFYVRVE